MSPADDGGARRRPDGAGFVIAALLVLAGISIAYWTAQMHEVAGYSPVGPKTFPYIISGGLFLLGLATAVEAWRGDFPHRERQAIGPMAWIVGGLLVQMLTIKTVGFSIATGILFAATAKGFGRGPLWLTAPVGIVFSFLLWLVFAKGLQLGLPVGPLERPF